MQAPEKLRILLIEDSISDAKLTQYALSRLSPSPELIHFDSGEAFFDFLQDENYDIFPLVLLDLNLPRMNGLEILKCLRRQEAYRQIPVVMFSSSKEKRDVVTSYEFGANAYVQKPITLEDFDQVIEAIVNFWSYANVMPNLVRI